MVLVVQFPDFDKYCDYVRKCPCSQEIDTQVIKYDRHDVCDFLSADSETMTI